MISAIDPVHAFGSGVSAILEIEIELDLITDALLGRKRLARLVVGERVPSREEKTTEDTEEKGRGQSAKRKVIFEQ